MKKTIVTPLFLFVLAMHSLPALSQTEDFFSFIISFSSDTSFQKSRVLFPLEIISWDYEKDVEETLMVFEDDYHTIPILNTNSDCSDGFMFVFPNTPMEIKEMALEIRGLTDASDKYWFTVNDGKWYLVRYRNYDF